MFFGMVNPFRPKPLTRSRILLAMAVAVVADGLQFGGTLIGGPLAWVGFVEAVDVVAMILTMLLLGFHVLLLPTFLIEFIPGVDMLPTWTGCVAAVILWRRNMGSPGQKPVMAEPAPPRSKPDQPEAKGPIIDV